MSNYNLPQILSLRDKLFESCFDLPGLVADQDLLEDLAEKLSTLLLDINSDTLLDSILDYAGITFTKSSLYELCWRVAGNLPALKQNKPLLRWSGQRDPEWIPFQIVNSSPRYITIPAKMPGEKPRKELYFLYSCKAMAGSVCPNILTKLWSLRFIKAMVVNNLGFTPSYGKLPFSDGVELVSLRFHGELSPELSKKYNSPAFDRIRCPTSCKEWNKSILTQRWREGFQCPMNWDVNSVPCYRCPKGYYSCPVACHSEDYLWGVCSSCKKEGWFDPIRSKERCVDCLLQLS